MLKAHSDRRPNGMAWFVLCQFAMLLGSVGECSPHPLISALGNVLLLRINTVGMYSGVTCVDKKADKRDVQNGYKLLTGLSLSAVQSFPL
jgi:hypothetical protein